MEAPLIHIISSYLNIMELQNFQNIRRYRTSTIWNVFKVFFRGESGGSKSIGISERFQRIVRWWNLDKMLEIRKS